MKWKTYLALGRVSNLPTVWSNTLAGVVLSGRAWAGEPVACLMGALSLFYVGGMFLNDAFDRHVDARIHPERPLPSGKVSLGEVVGIGFSLMALGEAGIGVAARLSHEPPAPALGAGLALGALIVTYDLWHKNNPIGPVLMGACRMLVYVSAALAVSGSVTGSVARGSIVLLSYLIGLTYVAKQETLAKFANFWPLAFLLAPFVYVPFVTERLSPGLVLLYLGFLAWVVAAVLLLRQRAKGNIPRAVIRLIAGISLFDGLLVGSQGVLRGAGFAVACFGATLLLQRYVRGT